ncbi:Cacna1c [Symbiodinium microadriaticum]|nr:Cacna1c [Symbiodinium microadriaticum]
MIWRSCQGVAARIVNSQTAGIFFAMVVLTNSVYLGVHLSWSSQNPEQTSNSVFLTVHIAYSVLFTLEAVLHFVAVGPSAYICGSSWAWNWLDLFVVTSSWIELAVDIVSPDHETLGANSNLRIMRLLRLGRLVRVVRIVRVVKLFRALRTLVYSLLGTLKSLFWSFLLLILIIYIFGILFTDVVLNHLWEEGRTAESENVQQYFGTLYASIITLFRSISNGITWEKAANSLEPISTFWVQVFHFYVAFCSFALLNVMTGVFCNSAIKAAERDHDTVVAQVMQTRKDYQDMVSNLFKRIDERGLGHLTITEFEKHFDDESVQALFEYLQIGAMDAWTLFLSLDKDGDHTISVDEFTDAPSFAECFMGPLGEIGQVGSEERLMLHAGERLGEAANPVAAENLDAAGGDFTAPMAAISNTVQSLQGPGGDKGKGKGAATAPAHVAQPGGGSDWTHVPKGKGKGAAQRGEAGKGKGVGDTPARPAAKPVQQAALRADDWAGKLLSVEELANYQGVGESIVLGVKDEHQALVVEAMIAGGGLQSSVLLAYPHPEGKVRLPYWTAAGVTMRAAVTKEFPHGTVALPKLKGKRTSTQTVKAEETEIVRVILAKDLADAKVWKLPVTDAWGAAEERRMGPVIVGLARVKVATVLGRSGQDGLFVEPTGRNSDYGVAWVETEAGEAVEDYYRRVAAIKCKWGLVMGRRQIGHRTETPVAQQVRAWRVPGVPRHWDAEVVKEVLEEGGFEQISITSRMMRKGTATWFVRATGKDDLATISVNEGSDQVELYVLPAMAEQFTTVIGAKESTAKDEQGKEVPAGKKAKLELRAVPAGAILQTMPRDGNCLAHSLGHGLTFLKQDNKVRPARLVRAEIHAYMTRKSEEFAGFWDGRNAADEEGKLANFAEYLKEIALDGKYLGCLELTAACRVFDLTLALWYHGDHYDLLLPEDKTKGYPAAITGVTAFGIPAGGRGGGGDAVSEADALTVYTWASGGGARTIASGRGPASEASRLKVHTVRDAFRAASLRASLARDHGEEAGSTAPTQGQDQSRAGQEHDGSVGSQELDVGLAGGDPCSSGAGGSAQAEHIRKHHADVADTLGKEERRLIFVPWSQACCWRCPVPGCGLGMKDDGTAGQDAPQDRAVNAAKASIACRNKGAASKRTREWHELKARLEDSDVATEIRDAINHTIETIEPCLQAEEAGGARAVAAGYILDRFGYPIKTKGADQEDSFRSDARGATTAGVAFITDVPAQLMEIPEAMEFGGRVAAIKVARRQQRPLVVMSVYLPVVQWARGTGEDFVAALEECNVTQAWQALSAAAEEESHHCRCRDVQSLLERRLRRVARRAEEAGHKCTPRLQEKLRRDTATFAKDYPGLLDATNYHDMAVFLLEQADQEAQRVRAARVRRWKADIQDDVSAMAKWVTAQEVEVACTPQQLGECPSKGAVANRLTTTLDKLWGCGHAVELDGHRLLRRARRAKTKAGGLDGWSGALFAQLPLAFFDCLSQVWQLVLRGHGVPEGWRQVRVVAIPKPDGGTRPLVLTQMAWRVGHVRKFFDRVSPEVALRVMRWWGAPTWLLSVLASFYDSQERWVAAAGCFATRPVKANCSLLQGCPFSPLLVNGMMAAWALHVRRAAPGIRMGIFLDDRTLYTRGSNSVGNLVEAARAGQVADKAMGFELHPDKLASFGSHVAKCEALMEHADLLGVPQTDFVLLGVNYRLEGHQAFAAADVTKALRTRGRRIGRVAVTSSMRVEAAVWGGPLATGRSALLLWTFVGVDVQPEFAILATVLKKEWLRLGGGGAGKAGPQVATALQQVAWSTRGTLFVTPMGTFDATEITAKGFLERLREASRRVLWARDTKTTGPLAPTQVPVLRPHRRFGQDGKTRSLRIATGGYGTLYDRCLPLLPCPFAKIQRRLGPSLSLTG